MSDKRTPWICANCGVVFGDEQGAAIVAGLRASNAEMVAVLKDLNARWVNHTDAAIRRYAESGNDINEMAPIILHARAALHEAGEP